MRALASILALALSANFVAAAEPLRDAPIVWYADDQRPLAVEPHERDPSLFWDYIGDSVVRPIARSTDPTRLVRHLSVPFGGHHVKQAANVNRLGEVPNGAWFTNRIGLFPMSPEAARRGAGTGKGPSRSGPWTVVGAKVEGVTPGFTIRDANGDMFLIKFDPPHWPGMASGAGVISARIFHAAGYHVPDDAVVYFRSKDLVLGDANIRGDDGEKRPMTETDIEDILARVTQSDGGSYRAISSRFLSGRPMGPFDFMGTRSDDANDTVRHEQRRELRGAAVFAAWLNHFDTKQHNTLDMLVEGEGGSYIRHHWIDFASTMGTGANGPVQRFGWEVTLDAKAFLRRNLTLGLTEDDWRRTARPEGLDEVAFFESEHFDPLGYEPIQPNPSFEELTRLDGYWAAKIISAFTDDHLNVIAREAKYVNPSATLYMARVLGERRDKIARAWFDRVAPLDFFVMEGTTLTFHDLGVERGIYEGGEVRVRLRGVDADRNGDPGTWQEVSELRLELAEWLGRAPFVEVECQVNRGDGWSRSITCYVASASRRVIQIERS